MAKITTHVLDTSRGLPAAGIAVALERKDGASFVLVNSGDTDDDGRNRTLTDPGGVPVGTYRLSFALEPYFARLGLEPFFPEAQITFVVRKATDHFHVPLLLSPFGYSTYRGS